MTSRMTRPIPHCGLPCFRLRNRGIRVVRSGVLYAIAFIADAAFVPKTIDRGGRGDGSLTAMAVLADVGLLMLFAVQHSRMARSDSNGGGRDIYRPPSSGPRTSWCPACPWQCYSRSGGRSLRNCGTSPCSRGRCFSSHWACPAGESLMSTFLINHLTYSGCARWSCGCATVSRRRIRLCLRGSTGSCGTPLLGIPGGVLGNAHDDRGSPAFRGRHYGHIMLAIQFEERDLVRAFGPQYAEYRTRVPMLVPGTRLSRG